MKAVKIDATNRTITEVQVNDFKDIQRHIGCDTFSQGMPLKEGDMLWVDDCGWMTAKKAFTFMGNVFAGNGLITGSDEDGEEKDCLCNVAAARFLAKFMGEEKEITDDMRERAFDSWTVTEIE
jgi:hypothetical protein|tara:strand:- start:769 stop:1137 length:369 start_codon:yes stop_codon:yes gene_type:complete